MKRILIVDDEPTIITLVTIALKKSGYDVVTAESGQQALDLLERDKVAPDVLFTDLNIPGMNGIELAIKVKGLFPSVDMIIASANYPDGARERACSIGIKVSLDKPYLVPTLLSAITQCANTPTSSRSVFLLTFNSMVK